MEWGLLKGLGDTAERGKETLNCLSEVLQANDSVIKVENDELIYLADRKKPIIFSMARLDTVKNMSGLTKWYGNGPKFLPRLLSSKLGEGSENMKPLLDYLLALNHRGEILMIDSTLDTINKLQTALLLAEVFLYGLANNTPLQKFEERFEEWDLLKGWGDTAERVKEIKKCQFRWIAAQTDRYRNGWRFRTLNSRIKHNTLVSGGVRETLPWMAPPGFREGGIVSNTLRPPIPECCDAEWRMLIEQC